MIWRADNPDLVDNLQDYTFHLPPELIAQSPAETRSDARLLLVRKNPTGGKPRFEDLRVSDLPQIVESEAELKNSLWLRNTSRVFPARFYAKRETGGEHEIVLLREKANGLWEAIVKRSARLKCPQDLFLSKSPETRIRIHEGPLVEFPNLSKHEVLKLLESYGEMPLPPYIEERDAKRDVERYQSVWSQKEKTGSVAAPTASLHFDEALLFKLKNSGLSFADLVLHVGLGTFQPLRSNSLAEESLHFEEVEVPQATLERLRTHKGPLVCVGSTALRTLESLSLKAGHKWRMQKEETDVGIFGKSELFIRPGFEFRYATALFTNFHLPASSLLVMLSCFCNSRVLALDAYKHAVAKRYRFFSYGDATLWI